MLSKVPDIEINNEDKLTIATCDVCSKAKQSKHAYSETRHRAQQPLKLVHTDMMRPIIDSVDGEKYIVTFIDDYTHYAIIFVMKNRADVAQFFINYERKEIAKFNRNIVTVRCDNAPEYLGGCFRDYLNERGITLQASEPCEHQHNGTSERFNRYLQEKMRALLYDTNLLTKY